MNWWMYLDCDEAVFCQETGAEIARLIHGTTDSGRVLTDEEVDAAGNLIAHAPKLLAALRCLMASMHDTSDDMRCCSSHDCTESRPCSYCMAYEALDATGTPA
jgi:hypothetical protein